MRTPDAGGSAIRTLARVHRWKRLLEDGKYRSAGELAEAEWVTRRPDIVETIFDGRQSKELQLEELTRAVRASGTYSGSWRVLRERSRNR
jgi:hypothetical protein